jgi:uncharacterized membrane protein
MKKMGIKGQKWLKSLHMLFVCLWVGGAVALSSKQFFIAPQNDNNFYGIMATLKYIDDFIIIPGAIGALLTGLIYSIWTHWGWFKHRWILIKWCICLYGVIFGTYPLGPWLNEMTFLSKVRGLSALADPLYLHHKKMLFFFGTFQALTLIFAVLISALKPWGKNKNKNPC